MRTLDHKNDECAESPDPKRILRSDGNLSSGDEALVRAAANGDGMIVLTPELMEQIGASIAARQMDIDARYPALVATAPARLRLDAVIACVRALFRHAREGGSYRFLIYERLEFGPDAYMPLCDAGLALSNDLEIDPGVPDPLASTEDSAKVAVDEALVRFRNAENDTRLALATAIFEAIVNENDPVESVVFHGAGLAGENAPAEWSATRAFLEACGLAAIETAWRRHGGE